MDPREECDGTLTFSDAAPVVAQSIISELEGALLVARPYGDVQRFERAADRLIGGLVGIPDVQPRTL